MSRHEPTSDDPDDHVAPGSDNSPEDDPTGMRDLLARLRDPGPMPPELVARIQARLGQEQHDRQGHGASPVTSAPFGASTEPARAGRTPRTGRWIIGAAAAAAVLVGGGAAYQVMTLVSGGDGASNDAGGAPAPAASTTGEAGDAPSGTPSSTSREASTGRTGFVLSVSGRDYTQDRLAAEATEAVDDPSEVPVGSSESPSIGPLGSRQGAQDCAEKLSGSRVEPVLVDVGTFDGTAGVLLVGRRGTQLTAWPVTQDCRELWPPVTLETR